MNESDISHLMGVLEEELMMKFFFRNSTRSDCENIENLIGEFPTQKIESIFMERGINIGVSNIPNSFSKYFSVMNAASSELRGKILVDFGCGLGVFVAQASKIGMHAEGIDVFTEYDGKCLEGAQCVASCISPSAPTRFTQLDFLAEDVRRDADFVTSFGMLEHIHGLVARDAILRRMMRTLRPGGYLILTCGPNRRFPFDLFHYGPKFLFYHCLPVKLRKRYLRMFSKKVQNQDPKWLNGMSVSEIKQSIIAHGGEAVEQLFPLWIGLAKTRILKYALIRTIAVVVANLLTRMQAEPVIILVARKKAHFK